MDRLAIEDDSRNKVNAENETVTLSDSMQEQLQKGHIFGRLLSEMHRTFTMRTGSSFQLAKEPLTGTNEANWEALIPQLRQYGIQVNESKA